MPTDGEETQSTTVDAQETTAEPTTVTDGTGVDGTNDWQQQVTNQFDSINKNLGEVLTWIQSQSTEVTAPESQTDPQQSSESENSPETLIVEVEHREPNPQTQRNSRASLDLGVLARRLLGL